MTYYLTGKFSDGSEYQAVVANGSVWIELPVPGGPITYAFSMESLVQVTLNDTDQGKPPWTPGGGGHGHQ